MFFIDESGSIPTFEDRRYKNRYFVIAFVHTNDPKKVKNVYKRIIRKIKQEFPDFVSNLENPKEIKGSDMYPCMKEYLLRKVCESTDIKVAHMVVDNWLIGARFRESPARSFNYLVSIIMKNFPLSESDRKKLVLQIDNRNSKVKSLNELEGFLHGSMVLDLNLVEDVDVTYHASDQNLIIQVADVFASTFYQRFRYRSIPFRNYEDIKGPIDEIHPYTAEYLYNGCIPYICTPFLFPSSEARREVAATRNVTI